MCRNSVVNVVEIKKESISTTVTTLLQHAYDHMENQALRIKIPNFFFALPQGAHKPSAVAVPWHGLLLGRFEFWVYDSFPSLHAAWIFIWENG